MLQKNQQLVMPFTHNNPIDPILFMLLIPHGYD